MTDDMRHRARPVTVEEAPFVLDMKRRHQAAVDAGTPLYLLPEEYHRLRKMTDEQADIEGYLRAQGFQDEAPAIAALVVEELPDGG